MAESDPDLIDAGLACAQLIADPKSWINRRVETVEMLSQEETRRRVSVDCTLPRERRQTLLTRHGVVVPISVLSKRALRNFDLRDEQGSALPALGRADNGDLALIALLSAAHRVIGDASQDAVDSLAADLRRIVLGDEEVAREALGALVDSGRNDEARQAIWADPACRSLLGTISSDYVLFAALPLEGPDRRVLKYGYGDDLQWERRRDRPLRGELWWQISRPDRTRMAIDCPGAWRAESFHMEIAIPEELRISHAVLGRVLPGGVDEVGAADEGVSRAALYAEKTIEPLDDIRAYVEVVAERESGAVRAALTAGAVAALLWLGWASGLDASQPGAAVSLLLAGAAIVSGFAASTGRHIIVNRILGGRRRALVLVAACALAASASLAMEVPDGTPLQVWLAVAILCSIASLRLGWSAIRAAG